MFGTFTAILLLIVFLVPGYIWRTIEGQFIYLDHRLPWEKFALGLLTRSSFLYLPFALSIYRCWSEKWYQSHPVTSTILTIMFVVALPACAGTLTGVFRQKDAVGMVLRWKFVDATLSKFRLKTFSSHRVPTAWEAVFNSRMAPCWVVVTRKNGHQIRGELGAGSHISVDPEDRDIFLSRTIYRDDANRKFDFVPGTLGVYIKADRLRRSR